MEVDEVVLGVIERIARSVKRSWAFGMYGVEDLRQEVYRLSIEALPRYEPVDGEGRVQPLEHFLRVHVRNRLLNLRRDKLRRNDPPCLLCAQGEGCGGGYGCPPIFCRAYVRWKERNDAKAMFASPGRLSNPEGIIGEESPDISFFDEVADQLPSHLREVLLRLRDGERLPASELQAFYRECRQALNITEGDGDE